MNTPIRTIVKLGVLLPEGNITCETEFPALAPAGHSFHYQRLHREGTVLTQASLLSMQDSVDDATNALLMPRPAAMVYACTSGTFLAGHDKHADMANRMEALSGVPCITTASAMLYALKRVNAQRIHMLTPYPEAINQTECDFLRFHGIDVVRPDTFGCRDSDEIRALSWQQVLDRVRSHHADASNADALFLSCTNMPALEAIETLEAELGIPVISSNSASAWAVLRLAGYHQTIAAIGALGKLDYQSISDQ
ncbi:maleate cis-trans isomerase family protein [Paracandidimonas soli]|uniref:Maleate isomerase n=1 Tax=Paracandidimonas soli TaxID=1917182 RepID=A0A4R3V134_9BURK|nr:aspartate/glutamate racemase family protein [Paracandidimonas soli]TCU95974.1 maleate isomerase [Paracandidimonas soli]